MFNNNRKEMKMFIIKWVETDEIYNYYPCVRIFSDYDKARMFREKMETKLEEQSDKMDSIFEGKILSEVYLEEIEVDAE